MRERRARASGWSTTVSCTGDTVSAVTSGWSRRQGPTSRSPAARASAGAGELRLVCRGAKDQDLSTVGTVGVPPPAGISLDAEAVVDLGVVAFAEQRGVLQAGLAAEEPGDDVVDLAPVGRGVTAGEDAVLVARLYRSADGRGDQALAPAHVER